LTAPAATHRARRDRSVQTCSAVVTPQGAVTPATPGAQWSPWRRPVTTSPKLSAVTAVTGREARSSPRSNSQNYESQELYGAQVAAGGLRGT